MSYLMRDVPATRYQLLDRPGTPYPADKLTQETRLPVRGQTGLYTAPYPAATDQARMSTEEQLARYLQEAYGNHKSSAQALHHSSGAHPAERW